MQMSPVISWSNMSSLYVTSFTVVDNSIQLNLTYFHLTPDKEMSLGWGRISLVSNQVPSWLVELPTPQVEDSSRPTAGTFQESPPIQFSKEETESRIGKRLACFNRKTPKQFSEIRNCKIEKSMLCVLTSVLYMGTINSVTPKQPPNSLASPDILQARNVEDLFLLLLYYMYM